MTINYTLYLATDAKPTDATEAVRPLIDKIVIDASQGKLPPGTSWIPDGAVSITAWTLDFLPGIAEENGIAAKLAVDFQLIVEETVEAKPIMVRDLLAILDKLPGDAVFHDVGDLVLLRRRGARLELNLSYTFWTPELRKLVQWPYESLNS